MARQSTRRVFTWAKLSPPSSERWSPPLREPYQTVRASALRAKPSMRSAVRATVAVSRPAVADAHEGRPEADEGSHPERVGVGGVHRGDEGVFAERGGGHVDGAHGLAAVVAAQQQRGVEGRVEAREEQPLRVGGGDVDGGEAHVVDALPAASERGALAVAAEDPLGRVEGRLDAVDHPAVGGGGEVEHVAAAQREVVFDPAAVGAPRAQAVEESEDRASAGVDLHGGVDARAELGRGEQRALAEPAKGPAVVVGDEEPEGGAEGDPTGVLAGAEDHVLRRGEAPVGASRGGHREEGEEARESSRHG